MRPHILFVDDEITLRELLSNYFRAKGYDVSIAATASEAIAMADQGPLHLVIMDINLAGENGLELLKFFKSNFPKLPVIMYTGMADAEELIEQAMFRGANGFMRKTDSLDNLFSVVKSYVRI
jgi:DNA-binding NtrC family response regulator